MPCNVGPPARTVGWRDPGFIHTSFLHDLWPNTMYASHFSHNNSKNKETMEKIYFYFSKIV